MGLNRFRLLTRNGFIGRMGRMYIKGLSLLSIGEDNERMEVKYNGLLTARVILTLENISVESL